MRYCFFGLNPGAMTKYPAGVAKALERRDPHASFVFIVDNPRGLPGVEFPARSEFVARGAPWTSVVRRTIREIKPDILITTGQRIPDSAYVSAAKEAGVPTAMFQHGLYLSFMRREPSLFLRQARKTLSYVAYASALAEMHDQSIPRYVRELSGVFVRGRPYAQADIDRDALNVDRVLLNGEYWRMWHSAQYGYGADAQVVVGYPDYDQLEEIERQPREEGICYVAQTLVEHGRLAERDFRAFLTSLLTAAGGRRLIVKLHPASDLRLYRPLDGKPNVELRQGRLPMVTHYVGHYSTYLALVPFLSRNLFLWEFEGHPIPDCVQPAASAVGRDPESLRCFLEGGQGWEPTGESTERWQHFFFRGRGSAFDRAADVLAGTLGLGGRGGPSAAG